MRVLRPHPLGFRFAVTLIEMLCVMLIICILASLVLPTAGRVYRKAKALSEEVEEAEIAERLRREVSRYCLGNSNYQFATKLELDIKCVLDPKTRSWMDDPHTDFVPFTYLDPTNKIVVTFHFGKNYSHADYFTKGALSGTR